MGISGLSSIQNAATAINNQSISHFSFFFWIKIELLVNTALTKHMIKSIHIPYLPNSNALPNLLCSQFSWAYTWNMHLIVICGICLKEKRSMSTHLWTEKTRWAEFSQKGIFFPYWHFIMKAARHHRHLRFISHRYQANKVVSSSDHI